MPIQYTAFTGNNAKWEDYAKNAVKLAMTALDKSDSSLTKWLQAENQATSAIFKKWFGLPVNTARITQVRDIVHRMSYCLSKGNITVTYHIPPCAANVNAAAFAPPNGWVPQNIATSGSYGIAFTLTLCGRFFTSLNQLGQNDQSQAGTVIHELSHLIGSTDDAKRPDNNQDAYGAVNAKWLAKNHPNLAINNAENFGFFCTQFGDY